MRFLRAPGGTEHTTSWQIPRCRDIIAGRVTPIAAHVTKFNFEFEEIRDLARRELRRRTWRIEGNDRIFVKEEKYSELTETWIPHPCTVPGYVPEARQVQPGALRIKKRLLET